MKIENNILIAVDGSDIINGELIIHEGITSIGDHAFFGCTSLTTIHLPERLTSIGDYAFYGCTSLTTIHLPENLTSIGNHVFNGCTSLITIYMPEDLISIGASGFHGCRSLTTIHLPKSLTSMGIFAFYDCSSLTTVYLPEGLTSIGYYAFSGCTHLTTLNVIAEDLEKYANIVKLLPADIQGKAVFIDKRRMASIKNTAFTLLFDAIEISPLAMVFKKSISVADLKKPSPKYLNTLPYELWIAINLYIGKNFTFYPSIKKQLDALILKDNSPGEWESYESQCKAIVKRHIKRARELKHWEGGESFFPVAALTNDETEQDCNLLEASCVIL